MKFLKYYIMACLSVVVLTFVVGFVLPFCFSAASTELVVLGVLFLFALLGTIGFGIFRAIVWFRGWLG